MTLLARERSMDKEVANAALSPDTASPPVAISTSLDVAKRCDTLRKIATSVVLHKLTHILARCHLR